MGDLKRQIMESVAAGETTPEGLAASSRSFDMLEDGVHTTAHTLRALGASRGIISGEEAVSLYMALGETIEEFNSQPLWVKVISYAVVKRIEKGFRDGENCE